jgi:CRP/FNR family transcriptional regulator, nitrogen fixation regulation protein
MITQASVQTSTAFYQRTGGDPPVDFVRRHGLFDLYDKHRTFLANEVVFAEGQPSDFIYKVIKGVVRSYTILAGGRRKIHSFRLGGDIFGIDSSGHREFYAEAVTFVEVMVARHDTPNILSQELYDVTIQELIRLRRHGLLLAMSARQRVAHFLVDLAQRVKQADILDIPMNRQDIADYLGLTTETVSRTLTQLETEGLIGARVSRHIVLRDVFALRRLSEGM